MHATFDIAEIPRFLYDFDALVSECFLVCRLLSTPDKQIAFLRQELLA